MTIFGPWRARRISAGAFLFAQLSPPLGTHPADTEYVQETGMPFDPPMKGEPTDR